MNDKISLLFCTCDKYEHLWNGFFELWERYWPTFNSNVILNTETKKYEYGHYQIKRPTFSKTDLTWSGRLYESLNSVETPYVLFVLDDFYLKSPVDVDTVTFCIRQMDLDKSIKLFTFSWQPGKNLDSSFSDIFEKRSRFAQYRINAQIGLWRVSYLRKIIKLYENPWEFEVNGSFRSALLGGDIYSLKKESPLVFDYDFGFLVVRGQLNKEVSDYFTEKEGVTFDKSMSYIDMDAYRRLGNRQSGKLWRKTRYLFKMIASLIRK